MSCHFSNQSLARPSVLLVVSHQIQSMFNTFRATITLEMVILLSRTVRILSLNPADKDIIQVGLHTKQIVSSCFMSDYEFKQCLRQLLSAVNSNIMLVAYMVHHIKIYHFKGKFMYENLSRNFLIQVADGLTYLSLRGNSTKFLISTTST